MQQMPNLQTALISCEHMETLVGALELSGHSNLKHLSLHNHYPTNLSIPKDCRLDVHGEAHTMQQVQHSVPECQPVRECMPVQMPSLECCSGKAR